MSFFRSDFIPGTVTTSETEMLQTLIAAAWSESALPFVVSNGIDVFTGEFDGRDLDVFVDRRNYMTLIRSTNSLLESVGWEVGIHWKSHTAWMFAFGRQKEVFEIDFFHYQQWHYFRFISSPKQLSDVINLGGFNFSPFAWLVKNVFIQLLARNFQKVEIRLPQLKKMLEVYPSMMEDTDLMLGSRVSARLQDLCLSPTMEALKDLSHLLRRTCLSLTLKQPKRIPVTVAAVFRWGQKLLEHKVLCRPMCPSVALVGVDGAGKSTIIKHLQADLPKAFPFWRIVVRHWRPEFLPLLSAFSSKPPTITLGDSVVPRSKPGKFGFLRSLYYAMDFFLGFFVRDRPVRSNVEALIYDRHFGDMVVDPVRFGIARNYLLLALSPLIPKPDILVFLRISPKLARMRKGEISDAKVARLNSEWLRIGASFGKQFYIVDAALPPSEISRKVCEIYFDTLRRHLNVPR